MEEIAFLLVLGAVLGTKVEGIAGFFVPVVGPLVVTGALYAAAIVLAYRLFISKRRRA